MTNAEYRAAEGVSKSDLDRIHISPLHYQTYKAMGSSDTPALRIGRAYHKLIGEPKTFLDEFAVAPHVDRRTKAGKEAWAEFAETVGDKAILTAEDFAQIVEMQQAFMKHDIAPQMIANGLFEQSFFWDDEDFDVRCKCRPDCITQDGYLVDFKTAASAQVDDFTAHAYKYRYHVQAWYYMRGYRIHTEQKPKGFMFIVQEKTPPYAVAVYQADASFIELGRIDASKDLRVYSECVHTGNWWSYGYNENTENYEVMALRLPRYAKGLIV